MCLHLNLLYDFLPILLQVCAELGKECKPELMTLLNTCPALNDKFPCRECISSMGMEQPAYVALDARPEFGPGKCLVTTQLEPAKSCAASHPATKRLVTLSSVSHGCANLSLN